jgi:hypothetical protein
VLAKIDGTWYTVFLEQDVEDFQHAVSGAYQQLAKGANPEAG